MSRMQILNHQALKEFEQIPQLKYKEKAYSFPLPRLLQDTALSFQNDSYFLIFTLLFGYFKITNKFYDDILYDKLVPLAIDTNAKWLGRNYVSFENLVQCRKADDEFTEIF